MENATNPFFWIAFGVFIALFMTGLTWVLSLNKPQEDIPGSWIQVLRPMTFSKLCRIFCLCFLPAGLVFSSLAQYVGSIMALTGYIVSLFVLRRLTNRVLGISF